MHLAILDDPKWPRRALVIKILIGTAMAIVTAWAAFGLPVPASRSYVEHKIGGIRIDSLESRRDIAELRLFLLDWTLRDTALGPQSRALIEGERLRTLDRKVEINDKLSEARRDRD